MYCGSGAAPAGYGASAADCDDCVELKTSYKTVAVPCTRNVTKRYTEQVPTPVKKTVPYTDYEPRTRKVPVMTHRTDIRYRTTMERYQVPQARTDTVMVPVTKSVPKTVYVPVTTQEPRTVHKTVMVDRFRPKQVPYTVKVPEVKYTTRIDQVPVQKTKTIHSTVMVPKTRTYKSQVTKIVHKSIPVVTAHMKPQCNQATSEAQISGGMVGGYSSGMDGGMAMGGGMAMDGGMAMGGAEGYTSYSSGMAGDMAGDMAVGGMTGGYSTSYSSGAVVGGGAADVMPAGDMGMGMHSAGGMAHDGGMAMGGGEGYTSYSSGMVGGMAGDMATGGMGAGYSYSSEAMVGGMAGDIATGGMGGGYSYSSGAMVGGMAGDAMQAGDMGMGMHSSGMPLRE